MEPKILLFAFAVGLSFAATFGTLTALAVRFQQKKMAKKNLSAKPVVSRPLLEIFVRLGYGFCNVINVWLGNTVLSSFGAGLLFGVSFVFLNIRTHAPLSPRKDHKRWKFFLLMPLLSVGSFVFVIRYLNQRFIFW